MRKIYEVNIAFKSAGGYFPKGHQFTEEEFYNQSIVRLQKIKLSEGYVIPLFLEDTDKDIPQDQSKTL